MRKAFRIILIMIILLCMPACADRKPESLTYAVYPYLPDAQYYCELIEKRWAEIEPDIRLVRAEWNCYEDGRPEGIDVIMYDAVKRDSLIQSGWIEPVKENDVHDKEDILPFALEGLRVNDQLYGIPVFLCGNFLIYDENEKELNEASHITDLSEESKILAINSDNPLNRPQYILEAIADLTGEANPVMDDSADEIMKLIDQLAVDACKNYDNPELAMAYDSGITKGYIGFSESMRLLQNRADTTKIKAISFSDKENIPRLYTDAAAITAGVKGKRYEKCVELINVMADAQVLTDLSVQNGSAQYLLLARKSPYQKLAAEFPMYFVLEGLASDPANQVILTP